MFDKKNVLKWLIALIVIIIAGVLFYFDLVQNKFVKKNNVEISTEVELKNISLEEEKDQYVLSIDAPISGMKNVDDQINAFVSAKIDETKKMGEELKTVETVAKAELKITGEKYKRGEFIKTIELIVYDYFGGAHGETSYKTFTYDSRTGHVYSFGELFNETENPPLKTIYPLVLEDLKKQLGEDFDQTWVEKGTGDKFEENYQNFVFDEDNLIIILAPYQVAPYAVGTLEVNLPVEKLNNILKADFRGEI